MKLSRTKEHHFGWLAAIPLLDVTFLLIFFLLLSSNFILQPGISVSVPLSRFTLGPQINPQIISITGGVLPPGFFYGQKINTRHRRALLHPVKKKIRTLIIKDERLPPQLLVVRVLPLS